jgi:DNA polymerase III epsilon subunit-like protein
MTRVFIDLETSGLDPQLHEPWEIAVIVADHADPALNGEWCWQVRPDLTSADPGALKIGGYWKRLHPRLGCSAPGVGLMLATHDDDLHPGVAVNAGEIADRLAGLLAGAELVGVNVQFDAAFLAEFLRRHNQAPSWDYHLTEMCSMARGWLHRGPIDYEHLRRSDDLSRACDVAPPEPEERHTALGDARWVQRWYDRLHPVDALAARLAANDATVLAEIDQAQQEVRADG